MKSIIQYFLTVHGAQLMDRLHLYTVYIYAPYTCICSLRGQWRDEFLPTTFLFPSGNYPPQIGKNGPVIKYRRGKIFIHVLEFYDVVTSIFPPVPHHQQPPHSPLPPSTTNNPLTPPYPPPPTPREQILSWIQIRRYKTIPVTDP